MSCGRAFAVLLIILGGDLSGGQSQAQELSLDIRFAQPMVRRLGPVDLSWRITNVGQRTLAVFSHVETSHNPQYDALTLTFTDARGGAPIEVQLAAAAKAATVIRCALAPGQSMSRSADVAPWLPALAAGRYQVKARMAVDKVAPAERNQPPCVDIQAPRVPAIPWIGEAASPVTTLVVKD